MTTVLVVEDEQAMHTLIDLQLTHRGYHVLSAYSGADALHFLQSMKIDLILLDVMMPEQDGFYVSREIRKDSQVPILFLTARDDKESLLEGYASGGDDFVTKPFDADELHVRIQAILKRSSTPENSRLLQKGILRYDEASRAVYVKNDRVNLTLKEQDILSLFMKSESRVFSREQLLERIWGEQYEGTTRTVDTHIKTLRIKLGDEAGTYIHTIWGVGYQFEVPHD